MRKRKKRPCFICGSRVQMETSLIYSHKEDEIKIEDGTMIQLSGSKRKRCIHFDCMKQIPGIPVRIAK